VLLPRGGKGKKGAESWVSCALFASSAAVPRYTSVRRLPARLMDKNIQHTVRYTELAPDRFRDFWR
jgi:hypothetical protein